MKLIKGLILLIIIAIIFIIFAFDNIAKFMVEKYGSESLHTSLSVADITTSFSDKSLDISNVVVQNPEGFSGNAFALNALKVQLASIEDEVIVVENFTIDGVVVNVVQNDAGVNIIKLKDNIPVLNETQNTSQSSDVAAESTAAEKRIIIKNLAITNTTASISSKLINDKLTIPAITMQNFGGEQGIAASQVAPYLLDLLTNRAKKALDEKGINVLKGKLEKGLVRKIGDRLGIDAESVQDIKDAAAEKKQELTEKIDTAKEELKEKASDAKKSLEEKAKDKLKNTLKF